MLIEIIRHGETEYNARRYYQGWHDIPLSEKGRKELRTAENCPEQVYVSPLIRAVETAEIIFPQAEQIKVPGLREMCFGVFEGRSYIEMEHDDAYRAWVDGGCLGKCPGGEDRAGFSDRVCAAFEQLVDSALSQKQKRLVIVAHGGTQMAVMERYAYPHRDYYDWLCGNGGGYVLDTSDWQAQGALKLVREVSYIKD